MLAALADLDPAGENMLKVNYVGSRGWHFRFNKTDFFVTTVAPCYPESSSRYYAFGSGRAFLLLQPELSFLRHDLPQDLAHARWEHPETVRDETRAAFRNARRAYQFPSTMHQYPMAEHVVKPVQDDAISLVRWWIEPSKSRH
jgi:hypothetical protein